MFLTSLAADAAIITTADGAGSDYAMRRSTDNASPESAPYLRIKNRSATIPNEERSGDDRIAVLNFDTTLEPNPITAAAVVVTTDLNATNQFLAGETLYLYGIPDAQSGENYQSHSFMAFPYSTGLNGATDPRPATDLLQNNVNDDLAVLLDSITFASPTVAGDPITFQSAALTSFVAADTNGIASFILTVSSTQSSHTPVIASAENTVRAHPTLLSNESAPVPEPSGCVLLAGLCLAVAGYRSYARRLVS